MSSTSENQVSPDPHAAAEIDTWLADGEKLRDTCMSALHEITDAIDALDAQRATLIEQVKSKQLALAKIVAILDSADDADTQALSETLADESYDQHALPSFSSKAGGPSGKPTSREQWHQTVG